MARSAFAGRLVLLHSTLAQAVSGRKVPPPAATREPYQSPKPPVVTKPVPTARTETDPP